MPTLLNHLSGSNHSRFGEVPVGSRKYFLLTWLAERLDRIIRYGDLKREVFG